MIFRPLKQIRLFTCGSNDLLLEVACVDGRAKWTESTKIVSLKFQVSDEVSGRNKLNALEKAAADFDLEILSGATDETLKTTRFCNFTVSKLELRSAAMSSLQSPLIWRYFIEGQAKGINAFAKHESGK